MAAEPGAWGAYVTAVMRIEAPGGAEFGQDAIFVLTPADRGIVSCTDQRVTVTGWFSEREH